MLLMNHARPSGLKFVTAGGLELTGGLSKWAFVGGTVGVFYVQGAAGGPVSRLPYVAASGGLGAGFSTAGAISLSVSLPWQPGSGVGVIYRNTLRRSTMTAKDLIGSYVGLTFAAGVLGQAGVSLVFLGAPRPVVAAFTALAALVPCTPPGSAVAAFITSSIAMCEGFGVLWGTAESNAVGVSVTGYMGMVVSCGKSDGETE